MVSKTTILGAALTLGAFATAAGLYDRLPAVMPVHWGLSGPDGFMAKPWGVYIYPSIIGGILLLKIFVRAISPQTLALEPSGQVFGIAMMAFMVLGASAMGVVFADELVTNVPFGQAVVCGFGGLLIVLGIYFFKLFKNAVVGGLFVLSGLTALCAGIAGSVFLASAIVFVATVLLPVVYSSFISRELDLQSRSKDSIR